MAAGACIRGTILVWNKRCPPSNRKRETRRLHIICFITSIAKEDVPFKVQQAKAKVLLVVETDETDSVIYYYHQNQRQDLELRIWNWDLKEKKKTCTQRNRWRMEDCFKLDLHFILQFKHVELINFFLKIKATVFIIFIIIIGPIIIFVIILYYCDSRL